MTLQEFFLEHPKVALACSGGVDSAYLLYAAKQYGADVCAYYVKSSFQPEFELKDAKRLAKDLEVELKVLSMDVLSDPIIAANLINRCYYCKKQIFYRILKEAQKDGYSVLMDGTNASDDADDRPGMKVLKELSVYSPLKMCGLQKSDVRRLSKEAGLFTWDKPAYACLATRISAGEEITKEKLRVIEQTEAYLFFLGFKDFRIRMMGTTARLQVPETELLLVLEKRTDILKELKTYFETVVLDLEVRR